MKLTPDDSSKSMEELMKISDPSEIENVMKRLTAFSANIVGSHPYWYKQKGNLEATFEQKSCATVFFTFSYADNWWACLHRLMPGNKIIS